MSFPNGDDVRGAFVPGTARQGRCATTLAPHCVWCSAGEQSPTRRGDCFAVARNDMVAEVNALLPSPYTLRVRKRRGYPCGYNVLYNPYWIGR